MRLSCLHLKLPVGRIGIELKGLLILLLLLLLWLLLLVLLLLVIMLLIVLMLLLLWRRRDTDGRYSVLVVGPGTVPIPVVIRRCLRCFLFWFVVVLVFGCFGLFLFVCL